MTDSLLSLLQKGEDERGRGKYEKLYDVIRDLIKVTEGVSEKRLKEVGENADTLHDELDSRNVKSLTKSIKRLIKEASPEEEKIAESKLDEYGLRFWRTFVKLYQVPFLFNYKYNDLTKDLQDNASMLGIKYYVKQLLNDLKESIKDEELNSYVKEMQERVEDYEELIKEGEEGVYNPIVSLCQEFCNSMTLANVKSDKQKLVTLMNKILNKVYDLEISTKDYGINATTEAKAFNQNTFLLPLRNLLETKGVKFDEAQIKEMVAEIREVIKRINSVKEEIESEFKDDFFDEVNLRRFAEEVISSETELLVIKNKDDYLIVYYKEGIRGIELPQIVGESQDEFKEGQKVKPLTDYYEHRKESKRMLTFLVKHPNGRDFYCSIDNNGTIRGGSVIQLTLNSGEFSESSHEKIKSCNLEEQIVLTEDELNKVLSGEWKELVEELEYEIIPPASYSMRESEEWFKRFKKGIRRKLDDVLTKVKREEPGLEKKINSLKKIILKLYKRTLVDYYQGELFIRTFPILWKEENKSIVTEKKKTYEEFKQMIINAFKNPNKPDFATPKEHAENAEGAIEGLKKE